LHQTNFPTLATPLLSLRFQGEVHPSTSFFAILLNSFFFCSLELLLINIFHCRFLNSPTCQRLSTLKKDGVLSKKVSRSSRTTSKAFPWLSSPLKITSSYIRTVSIHSHDKYMLFACFCFRVNWFDFILLLFS